MTIPQRFSCNVVQWLKGTFQKLPEKPEKKRDSLFNLDPRILADIKSLHEQEYSFADIARNIFIRYGEMPAPETAHYFREVLGGEDLYAYVTAFHQWWPTGTSDITDEKLNELIKAATHTK